LFKPTINTDDKKELRSIKDSEQREKKRGHLVSKKRAAAAQQGFQSLHMLPPLIVHQANFPPLPDDNDDFDHFDGDLKDEMID
jgi:hypothetical protein